MNVIRNFSIRTKLSLLTAFLLTLIFVNSLFNRKTLNEVRVLGPLYSEIASGKDLVADILPPPAYIIETYLTSHALADAEDLAESNRLIEVLDVHKTAFEQRMDHWGKVLPEGTLRESLLGDARTTAEECYKIAEQKLVPLVREKKFDEARTIVGGELKTKYEEHYQAIGKVVKLAEEYNKTLEASAQETLNASAWWTNILAVFVCGTIGSVIWFTSRNATRRLAATRQLAKALAAGDFSQRLEIHGGDEIDLMGAELSDASRKLNGSISQMIHSMEAAANKDYTKVLVDDAPGDLNRGKVALNSMLNALVELNAENVESKEAQKELLNRVASAIMVVDMNFIVQYVNKATMNLFAHHADSFRKLWPDFDASKIVGTCIDKFHKVPSHQRKLLSDPQNLPLKTDITVGNAKIQLHVTPVTDISGKPTGFSLEWSDVTALRDSTGQLEAINKSQAVIEFQMDGTVMHANENFLKALGYTMDEIRGKHHSLFVSPEVTTTAEYRQFWANLNDGKYDAGEYKRIAKGGREVWIQASYNPIVDGNGKPFKVVKYATDITASKLRNADYEGQLAAIDKAQATIEFDLNGNILKVNDNFLNAVGYSREEVVGKHHSIFVDSETVSGNEYRQFWNSLKAGQYQASTNRRVGKAGREVWIQASYNPIYDVNGKLQKIVKYAADITEAKQRQMKLESDIAERHRQDARAAEEMKAKVAQVLEVVNAVADGNFDLIVPDLGDDAVGQVARALDVAVASIRTALLSVQSVSETVASAASQMTSASNEISKGAQHQASSLEETASSLEQITSTVKQNTDNAQQARQLANGSRDVAEKGGAVLTDAIKAMGEINQSSTKIADIITTIDEIAFQTNLLALNAAVEAARAGEQGRGFAVVAAEVRNLSQRSALAAKEIKSLIQDSVRKVENGTALVNQSGKTLEEIVGSVKRVTDIVAEIAAASKEQLTGIEQVNKAVAQMDRVTQNNASQTEEMAGTAESLLGHSSDLRDLVGKFRLEKQNAGSTNSSSRRADGMKPLKARPVETDIEKVTSKLSQMAGTGAGYVEF